MRTLHDIIGSLPTERRDKVVARGRKLIEEEVALRHLRQARELTQKSMAALMKIDQTGISKIESRSDMMLSTLRSYVEAMGGSLKLTAEFADGTVEIATIGGMAVVPSPEPKRRQKAKSRRTLVEG